MCTILHPWYCNEKYGMSSCNTVNNKVCEACNYIHLVNCPMNDLHCENTKRQKRKRENKNQYQSSSLINNRNSQDEGDKWDSSDFHSNEEIKIEGKPNNKYFL